MSGITKSEELKKEFGIENLDGLNDAKVLEQREKYGENTLKEKKKQSLFVKFLLQFKDILIIILSLLSSDNVLYPDPLFYKNKAENTFSQIRKHHRKIQEYNRDSREICKYECNGNAYETHKKAVKHEGKKCFSARPQRKITTLSKSLNGHRNCHHI